eukprot:COSAG03_NODE_206_length_10644_cov_8.779896_8_plen_122_part_00
MGITSSYPHSPEDHSLLVYDTKRHSGGNIRNENSLKTQLDLAFPRSLAYTPPAAIGKTPAELISNLHVQVELISDAVEANACASEGVNSHSPEPAGAGRSASSDVMAVAVRPLSLTKNLRK